MIDLIIILAFVAYSIASGFKNRAKASQSLEEYFLAGRSIKGWQAGFSMAATQFAADTPLLVTGLIATGGIFMLWRLWIYGLGFLMIGFLLGRAWRRAHVITDAELTEIRYSGRGVLTLRGLKAIYYGTIMNCTIIAMVLVAATRISEIFMPWHLWLPGGIYHAIYRVVEFVGVPLASGATGLETYTASTNNIISIIVIILFTALYSTTGGLRAVIATDVVQFSLAIVGMIVYAIIVLNHTGGIFHITEKLTAMYGQAKSAEILNFAPNTMDTFLPFLVIISLQWFFERNSDGTGYFAQRIMGCRSTRDAEVAAFSFSWLQIFLRSIIWLVIGVGLLIVYPFSPDAAAGEGFAAAREITFAQGINDLLPIGLRGIVLTGMLAALASTIDTQLTWGASYWSNDLYLRIVNRAWLKREPSSKEMVLVARISNAFILIIALLIMANLGSIQTAWYITLLFGAGTGAVLVLRWLWERANLFSEISALIASLIFAPIILYTVEAEWLRLLLMASISTIVVIIVTLSTRPTHPSILNAFYRQVDPPGFWKKTAAAVGLDPRRPIKAFGRGVYMTLTTSLSLYLLLLGVSKLLLPSPGQSHLHAFIYIVPGVASIFLWWKKMFSGRTKSVQVE